MPDKRILIVDDQQYIQNFLSLQLKKWNFETSTAVNGSVAVMKARNESPDLILMDIMMPEMDGIQACKIIKEDDSTKDIPVIFLTARGQKEDIMKAMSAGATDYIIKPFTFGKVITKIAKVLDITIKEEAVIL